MRDRQLFFTPEGEFRKRLKPLSKNQRSVLSLLDAGLLQAGVSDRLRVSRPYVNQIVKSLESLGLIQRRKPTYFYDLSPEARSLLSGTQSLDEFTPARLHNFKKKYRILSAVREPCIDKRANYQSSWKMRGPMRHKYWYPGESGIPSVTVDYHIRSLVIYIDKGQEILARSVEEAKAIGWLAIQKARDAWLRDQRLFSCEYSVEEIGTVIAKVHAGFVMMDKDPVIKEVLDNGGNVGYSDYWVDKSVEKEMGAGHCEAETAEPENMTRLGRGIQMIEAIEPDAFKEIAKVGGLCDSIIRVEAMLQGSITTAMQNDNILKYLSKIMDEMQAIRIENAELKKQLPIK